MDYVHVYLTSEFPHLVSYPRFVALIATMMIPMLAYLQSRYGACTGISFIDSTSLSVCDPKRISQHRVFALDAKRGKSSMGWFYGFKLHLAVNDRGELLACCLTPGNVDDRTPVPQMVGHLRGKLIGDREYICAPLTKLLFEQGLQLITRLRKNRKNHLMHLCDKLLVRKRAIIESIIDQLKNISETLAFSPSQSHQLRRSFDRWTACLQSSRQKAQSSSRSAPFADCLIGMVYPELTFFTKVGPDMLRSVAGSTGAFSCSQRSHAWKRKGEQPTCISSAIEAALAQHCYGQLQCLSSLLPFRESRHEPSQDDLPPGSCSR